MTTAKKSAKLNPAIIKQRREAIEKRIIKQRREAIEKRIVKLEGKLNKDRALLLRYTTNAAEENAERGEAVTSE